ncbi:MAG: hypothetical protein B6D41_17520 [Chloroflexi bacterium UTCFX4]|nr:MAG: hypothetical protein B6D41_17520 [Chloroflexi bacterium UTCFX4]
MIQIKRVYEAPARGDGARFLVERLWPRGLKKEELDARAWLKEVAPSAELRQWFAHDPSKWSVFKRKYFSELDKNAASWAPLLQAARRGNVTLLYSARDTEHNNAIALKTYLDKKLVA